MSSVPRCYNCQVKPAKSLKISGVWGKPVFCSLRCAAEAAYNELGMYHVWCEIHQTWNNEDDLVLNDYLPPLCPMCDIAQRRSEVET